VEFNQPRPGNRLMILTCHLGDGSRVAWLDSERFGLRLNFWPVETNSESTAYIQNRNRCVYVQGCVWGSRGANIETMVNTMKNNINTDLSKNLIAIWHDESHLNKFMVDNIKESIILSPSMAYPEHWNLPLNKLVIHKDKNMVDYPRFKGATPQ